MFRLMLFHALVFGFWLPPLLAGLWMAGRRQRVMNLPQIIVGWSLIWVVCLYSMFPPFVGKRPTEYYIETLLLVACLLCFATVVVLPISAVACWIGNLRGTPIAARLKFPLALITFALVQVLLVAMLLVR